MANIASAKKRSRQNLKRRLHNTSQRSMLRTQLKRVMTAIEKKDKETARQAFDQAAPVIDKMANKGIIHKNKAARHKSHLNDRIRAL
ncbi:MAG: 30S ribosomal protein S20 [Gammaproteobacteria bacterium]